MLYGSSNNRSNGRGGRLLDLMPLILAGYLPDGFTMEKAVQCQSEDYQRILAGTADHSRQRRPHAIIFFVPVASLSDSSELQQLRSFHAAVIICAFAFTSC